MQSRPKAKRFAGRRGWLFPSVLLVGVGAILAFWYFASRSDAPVQPTFGGDYIEGVAGEPLRVNPLFASENAADQTLVSLVFAGLTRVDDKGAAFPDLAETWTVSPDGLDYTFTLRGGLVWQDGTPLTSEDVVYTYGLLASPGLHEAPPLAAVLEGAQIDAPDPQTVTIALTKPFSPLPSYLTLGILPKHLLGDLDFGQLYDSLFNQQPIGAGPYRLEHLTPSEAVLVANPSYYLEQPFIQRLQIRFYPDDGAVLQALDAGQITAALFHQTPGPNDMLALQSHPNLRFMTLDTGEVTFGLLQPQPAVVPGPRRAPGPALRRRPRCFGQGRARRQRDSYRFAAAARELGLRGGPDALPA